MTRAEKMAVVKRHGRDILKSDGMKKEHKFIQHGKISVFKHSLSVAVTCVEIADKLPFKINKRALVRGALLHDYFLYDWHVPDKSHKLHGFSHAETALKNAKRDFKLGRIEKNMIRTHMFPLNLTSVPTHRESMILCLADKIVATRETVDGFKGKLKRKKR